MSAVSVEMQDLFDRVVTHLFQQGRPSRIPGLLPRCRYRFEDPGTGQTLRCAIGFLINDRAYKKELECKGVAAPPVLQAVADSLGVSLSQVEPLSSFLGSLQKAHDRGITNSYGHWASRGEELAEALRRVADQFLLSGVSLDRALAEYQKGQAVTADRNPNSRTKVRKKYLDEARTT